MQKHITVLAVLHIAWGALGLLGATITFISIAGGGLISGEGEVIAITATVGTLIGGIIVVMSIPSLIGGLGLLKLKSWARYLVLVLGFLNLPGIPVGTALGIYTIWVLLKDETARLCSA